MSAIDLEIRKLGVLNRVLAVSAASLVIGGGGLVVKATVSGASAAAATVMKAGDQKAVSEAQRRLADVPDKNLEIKPGSIEVVVQFQHDMQALASANGCQVTFEAVGDPQMYISKFDGEAKEDWKQVEFSLTISGTPNEVFRSLSEALKGETLLEYGDFEISRSRMDTTGKSIDMKMGVKVLFKA